MTKKVLLFAGAILVVFTIGFMATAHSYRATILNSLTTITEPLQSTVTTVQTAWASIPEPYKGYANLAAIGGVPTALMMFFAWTKQRAMRKLQQTQQQASQQITALTSQKQSLLDERDAKIRRLESELLAAKNNTSLQSSLSEAQSLVTQKQQELKETKLFYEGRIQSLQEQIKLLEDRLRVKPLVK